MLTEEQRAELELRGWLLWETNDGGDAPESAYEEWAKWSPRTGRPTAVRVAVRVFADGPWSATSWDEVGDPYPVDPFLVAEFLAILGIAPPGYRLVPEHVAHAAIQQALDDLNS